MFIEPAIIGLLFAFFKKGRLRNIGQVNIRGYYLFFIAAIIQVVLSLGKGLGIGFILGMIENYFIYIYFFTYLLLSLGILLNMDKKFMRYILIGIILNGIVIFSNNGKMPVSIEGISGIGEQVEISSREYDIKHKGMDENTKFKYLGDIILIPKPYPLARVMSIGDLFIMLGLVVFFPENMVDKKNALYITPYLTKKSR